MSDNLSNVEISVQELKLLVNTLTKSVALSLRKRYTWLGVIAGFLIGSCLTFAIISLTWKQTDRITTTTQTLLKESRETLSEVKQINSKISKLAHPTHGPNEKKPTDYQMSASTGVGKTKLNEPQNIIRPGRYTVYVHYTNKKNKKLMERFSAFLTHKGFKVNGIQKVRYHNQDVRYFHDEDKEGALVLKKFLTDFFPPMTNINGADMRIINLSHKYPNAQKGALELWLNLN